MYYLYKDFKIRIVTFRLVYLFFLVFKESEIPKSKSADEITLDTIPDTSKYLKIHKLEEEGKKMFDALLQFQASPHISRYIIKAVLSLLTALKVIY